MVGTDHSSKEKLRREKTSTTPNKNTERWSCNEYRILHRINDSFIDIEQEDSRVLIMNQSKKIREITRGLYNRKFDKLIKNKEDRVVVKEILTQNYDNVKRYIYLK
ncbi:unnamed protein product [Rhizophagus irregularis]|nr:unnamed protein product [Rhizophagus irregularis]